MKCTCGLSYFCHVAYRRGLFMDTPHTHGFSLWLVPPEPVRNRLENEIIRWSGTLGTPLFEPHITLLGGIKDDADIAGRMFGFMRGVGPLKPIAVELGSTRHEPEFYRCVYLNVWLTKPLRKMHDLARAHFRYVAASSQDFIPHMSMVYGKVDTQEQAVIARDLESLYKGEIFTVSEVALWETEGPPDAWRQLSVFPF